MLIIRRLVWISERKITWNEWKGWKKESSKCWCHRTNQSKTVRKNLKPKNILKEWSISFFKHKTHYNSHITTAVPLCTIYCVYNYSISFNASPKKLKEASSPYKWWENLLVERKTKGQCDILSMLLWLLWFEPFDSSWSPTHLQNADFIFAVV